MMYMINVHYYCLHSLDCGKKIETWGRHEYPPTEKGLFSVRIGERCVFPPTEKGLFSVRIGERCVFPPTEKGLFSVRIGERCLSTDRERAVFSQTNSATDSKTTLDKRVRDGVDRMLHCPKRPDSIWNWTQLSTNCQTASGTGPSSPQTASQTSRHSLKHTFQHHFGRNTNQK